jgi:predicted methyltransferase
MLRALIASALLLAQIPIGLAADKKVPMDVTAAITAALGDPSRPPDDVARDAKRKPAELIAFAGLKPGDRVADFMSGGGYFTRIFSRVVGDSGRVYAFVPDEQIKNCKPEETAGTRALDGDRNYRNVTIETAPVNRFGASEPLDLVWTSQNYHDLHDKFMGPANIPQFNRAVFNSLKPGGVFLVIDHAAQPGSGARDTEKLHRIDKAVVIREVEAAGFHLETQSNLLRNAADTHELNVFDPAIRGRTDQMVLRFRKLAR